ncbi:hypothetical protein MMC18_005213 [Xylographa bjoerkii]|nr:hypothetical protein [Xylographa bjoerkii]
MQTRVSPLYLNRDYAYWQRIASKNGIAAVLAKWGDPKSQSRVPKIGRTLRDALDAVEAFQPRLAHKEVVAVFKLYEKSESRGIRNTPLAQLSGKHGTTTPDSEELATDSPNSPDSPYSPDSPKALDPSSAEFLKQESKKLKNKKVRFNELSPRPDSQKAPDDSPAAGPPTDGPSAKPFLTNRPPAKGSSTKGSPSDELPPNRPPPGGPGGTGSPAENPNPRQASQSRPRIDNNNLFIQLYPTGASAGDGSAQVFPLREFVSPAYAYRGTNFKTRHLSLIEFQRSWPDRQVASENPLRWDVPTEAFTYSLRQAANIIVVRKDLQFWEAVRLLRAELSGDPDDNLITFYLRPRLIRRNWQAVDFHDGAPEIHVHDEDGPLLPTINFREIIRSDLLPVSDKTMQMLYIMGVHALSFHALQRLVDRSLAVKHRASPGHPRNVRIECDIEGASAPIQIEDDYTFHKYIRLLQTQRALRQDDLAPLIFNVTQALNGNYIRKVEPKTSALQKQVPEGDTSEASALGSPIPENFATEEAAPEGLAHAGSAPNNYQPSIYGLEDTLQAPKTPLPERPKKVRDSSDAEVGPSITAIRASDPSSRLIDDGEDDAQEASGAFTISLDLVDRSINQPIQNISMQMKEFLIQRFHCPPEPIFYSPFPGVVNRENYRYSETLDLEELFNDENIPGIVSLKLVEISRKRHEYRLSKAGKDYPYRGRGPVSSQVLHSSAIDSCLVAAKLLDVGRLSADTLGETTHRWNQTLDDFNQLCIQAINKPWGIYTYDTSIQQRDDFYNIAIDVYNRIVNRDAPDKSMTTGDVLMAARMWEVITLMANQFTFTTCHRTACVLCFEMPVASERRGRGEKQVLVNLDQLELEAGSTPLMSALLTTYFGQSNNNLPTRHDCPLWESPGQIVSQRLRLVIGALPLRLVVRPPTKYLNVQGATSDRITFKYSNFALEEVDVKVHDISYRWLGGIYQRNGARRVYWTDGDYGTGNQDVRFYDSEQLCGCIVGGFKPGQAGSRVPAYWAEGTELLFYERLNKDNKDLVLSEVEDCVAKLRGNKSTGLVSTITSFFSSPRQNGKRPRGQNNEDEMDIDTPSAKKPKLGSPFQYIPTNRP